MADVGESVIFSVSTAEYAAGTRVTLNGAPVGPRIEEGDAQAIVEWFTGYLEDRVRQTIQGMVHSESTLNAVDHFRRAADIAREGREGVIE